MRRPALALLLGCLLLVAGVSALDGYDYYQTIEYAACDQEIYQQDIVVHRTTGTAYNETSGGLEIWHIYVGDHCREDYGDVRFTNSAGAELTYYLWPDYSSESARFAVRLEGADAAGVLQVWYGNPTAATTSDPSALPTVYTETGSHTYTVPDGVSSVAVLIVGGGGGGAGRDVSGGGGAGGLIFRPAYTVTPGSTLSVYIGAGGSGGVDPGIHPIPDSTGENGESTTFGDLIALGGGGGGHYQKPGVSGGSGGGAGREASPNVGGSSLQPLSESGGYGNAGGKGSGGVTTSDSGGGGGGAGEPGVNGVINQAGRGGHGLSAVTIEATEYSFAAFFGGLGVGHEVNGDLYFGGGGGGSTHRSGTANVGIGGYGGGGSGASPNGVPGTPNTGGGGGASRGTSNHGGAGGSGVVLIRTYSATPPAALTFSGEVESDAPQPFPGLPLIPRDLTGNGLYTDINGNNRLDYNDLTVFFQHLAWAKTAQPIACFDFNGNGWLDYNDVITLFSIITEEHP